jgi:hypothetical protein
MFQIEVVYFIAMHRYFVRWAIYEKIIKFYLSFT